MTNYFADCFMPGYKNIVSSHLRWHHPSSSPPAEPPLTRSPSHPMHKSHPRSRAAFPSPDTRAISKYGGFLHPVAPGMAFSEKSSPVFDPLSSSNLTYMKSLFSSFESLSIAGDMLSSKLIAHSLSHTVHLYQADCDLRAQALSTLNLNSAASHRSQLDHRLSRQVVGVGIVMFDGTESLEASKAEPILSTSTRNGRAHQLKHAPAAPPQSEEEH